MKSLYYHKEKPSHILKDYVDIYWSIENVSNRDIQIPIVPDGCIDIVINDHEIFLVGMMSIASIKIIQAGNYYLGIRFKPAVMGNILNLDVSEFNDKHTPLELISPQLYKSLKLLEKRVIPNTRLDAIFDEVISKTVFDYRILSATSLISSQEGDIDIDILCKKYKLSQKQLSRLFVKQVGITPKKFARFIRLVEIHKHLTKDGLDDLCLKILEKGYYDQSHFNREYKLLTGLTPTSQEMSIFYNTNN